MAEDIVIGVEVDPSGKGAKSLKTLKDEFRVLQKELENTKVGTKEYQQSLERLGAVKDEIGDLRDTISALNPEGKVQAFTNVAGKLAGGFQAATGAAALFGAQSEELEKQLLKVQAATALAQGIQSVVGLSDAFAVLGTVIKANPIMALASVIIGVTTAIVAYTNANSEAVKQVESLTAAIKDEEDALDSLRSKQNDDLEILAAKGAKYQELAVARVAGYEAEIKELKVLQGQYSELYGLAKEGSEEQKKAEIEYNKVGIEMRKLRGKIELEFAKADGFLLEESVKAKDKAEKEKLESIRKAIDESKRLRKQYEEEEFLTQALNWETVILPQKQKEAQDEIDLQLKVDNSKEASAKKLQETKDALAKKELENKQLQADRELQIETNYLNAVTDLSVAYFNYEINAAKGNAKKIDELRKKQFNIEKAISAVRATISTFEAINKTIALGGPLAVPLAISIGVAGFANVAKILSTQYNGGAVPSNSNPDLNTGGVNIQTQAPVTTSSTRLNEQGQNLSLKDQRVYLVESDVTESQGRVARLQEQSTF